MSRAWFSLAAAGVLVLVYMGFGLPTDLVSAQQQAGENGSIYTVATAGATSILCESRTGRTWSLRPSADRTLPAVWLPIERIDDPNEATKWHALEAERAKKVISTLGPQR